MASVLLLALTLFAQESPSRELDAVRATTRPTIDGKVGESEWLGAARATDFVQFEPRRGDPTEGSTEALVMYDDTHIYVAFRAFDTEAPLARITQRDADLLSDDAVMVLIDCDLTRQSASYFTVNPLGTQAEGRITEDGSRSDPTWDAPWQSAAHRHRRGWSAEFAIPLSSLRYSPGHDRAWGLNLARSRPRTRELGYWAGPLDKRNQVSHEGLLVGLDLSSPQPRRQLLPYLLSRLEPGDAPGWQAGLDVRYSFTPNLTAFGTLNPDFAIIEADEETVNLTRFELSLPEKRPFFLEGNELFAQRIRTFYSRRIADVRAGAKLLGRAGRWNLEALSAQADVSGAAGRGVYTVARAQRELGRSFVAGMVANRRLEGEDRGAVGVDANLLLTRSLAVTAQAVRSHGPFGQGGWGLLFRPSYDTPTTHVHFRYNDLGPRLADNLNAVGFVPDDDRRELDASFFRTFWPRSGPLARVRPQLVSDIYWGHDGRLRGWEVRQRLEAELRSGWSATATHTDQFRLFEKGFRNRELDLRLGYKTHEYQSVQAGYSFGRNFDADFGLWSASGRRKLTERLSAEYEMQRLRLRPDPQGRSTWIHVIRGSYFLTTDLLLKAIFQTHSAIDRKNVQAVVVYRYRPPFGSVQLAYQHGTAAFGERSEQGHTLLLKVTGVF